ncbi:hypothetical protein DTL42_09470 [Bremerella cremea]|uniref:Uncharacterized protein n=1 Tax=Bremerella cremea TaxID=1031537 RepID=A0A368KWD0_9BACT|nr:hypothetical protein DTL42_09470 [Bremerella cremea]
MEHRFLKNRPAFRNLPEGNSHIAIGAPATIQAIFLGKTANTVAQHDTDVARYDKHSSKARQSLAVSSIPPNSTELAAEGD